MINNYGMYYYHENNDTLRLFFSLDKPTRILHKKEVDVLYSNDKLVGYNIPNIMRFVKIKYHGIIFAANSIVIQIINSILEQNDLEPIAFKNDSGYHIKTENNFKGVYASPGTFMRDERISKGQFCTYYDLYIDNECLNQLVEVTENEADGTDIYTSKEIRK